LYLTMYRISQHLKFKNFVAFNSAYGIPTFKI
jgi:hypothetical protein